MQVEVVVGLDEVEYRLKVAHIASSRGRKEI